ncbi:flagellar hook-associated protein FlgL [Paenibacillus sp. GCM10012306]|uniref:flagellar hook-associated protein FlgL n=1 Tax=Paenibacillus sp. GCM10012306 TaxID=3317342 RepID=UPI003623CD1D
MIIAHNPVALQTNNKLQKNNDNAAKAISKLSSGLRINQAADDAAGLAISEKMRGQIRGLTQASRNTQDGISLIQTAEGALGSIGDILQRIRELAVQSANGTLTDEDRSFLQSEVAQLKDSIHTIGSTTEFNRIKLLDGSMTVIPATPPTPAIPPSSSIDVSTGGNGKTIADGDIPIGVNGAVVRLNPNEHINTEENYSLSIDWLNGSPVGLTIHRQSSGTVVTLNNPNLIYSVNGITFDISGASNANTAPGNQHQGDVVFHPGNNSAIPAHPGAPAIDNSLALQVGANSGQSVKIAIDDYRTSSLGINGLAIDSKDKALEAIQLADFAISKVSGGRAKLGATQNRLEHTNSNLTNMAENLTSAESRIRDVDMAKAMMEFTKNNILTQAAQAMLAQSNQLPQSVLSLLSSK